MKGLFPWLFELLFGPPPGPSTTQCTGSKECNMWRDLRCGSGCCSQHCSIYCKNRCLRADAVDGVLHLPPKREGIYR